jgi:HK97 family phage portal protein
MSILDFFKREKASPGGIGGGSLYSGIQTASRSQDKEAPLRAYGENVWLHGAVSKIAQSVGETEWTLYEVDKDGNREPISGEHELKDLLNKPNPQESGHDLMELNQIYYELCGKSYIVCQQDKGRKEMWVVPAPWMKPELDKTGNITAYKYRRGAFDATFAPEDVIPFVHPDPLNPTDGIGWVQSAGLIIDTQSYAEQYNRNYFYRGADPGIIVRLEGKMPQEEVDRMISRWESRHRGYGAAHSMSVISGATEITQAQGMKDMNFPELLKMDRDMILGAAGLPPSMLGVTENANRAVVETADYTFSRWVLKPRLALIKRKLNEFLVVKFGDNLELDYDDPTPQNRDAIVNEVNTMVRAGVYTREMALQMLNHDIAETEGGTFLQSSSQFSMPGIETAPPVKAIKKAIFENDNQKESYWNEYVKGTASFEKAMANALTDMFGRQKTKAINELSKYPNDKLVDITELKKDFESAVFNPMSGALDDASRRGKELLKPNMPHRSYKDGIPPVLSTWAMAWLKRRIGWAATEVGLETEALLRQALIDGYALGESIPQLTKRVESVFEFCTKVRAERIARTETMMAAAQGTIDGYKDSGVVSKTEFYTAMDERTCDDCNSMHKEIFPLDDSEGVLPLHPNCRCVWLPVVEW